MFKKITAVLSQIFKVISPILSGLVLLHLLYLMVQGWQDEALRREATHMIGILTDIAMLIWMQVGEIHDTLKAKESEPVEKSGP